ncbi:MAG: type II secretion system protein GspE [Proteobacteria bacterium]|nr:type II secretion system protein GspE [Pseudomonadota bacterium]
MLELPNDARLLPFSFARKFSIIARASDHVQVWSCGETPAFAISEVNRKYGCIELTIASKNQIDTAIKKSYQNITTDAAQVLDEFESDVDLARLLEDMPEIEDLLESADDAPVIRMINALLTQALREGSSDIHIEPFETISIVRFRVDGQLREIARPKKAIHSSLVSRIKIMSQLDIAEKRLPQDGRITIRIGGKPVDVRVSTLPTGYGERAVLRLLDKEEGRKDLKELGMSSDSLKAVNSLLSQPNGIILVTGPTGSGKTTTLYASLTKLNETARNILTVEDPIEYELSGVGQTQVNPLIGLNFGKALRAILRQDPDVLMIGEIRDLETAQIAVQASLTGHLVLATLHTNDSVAAITRLLDMGIEPFLLSSSLMGIIGQRLVRKLCIKCRQKVESEWQATGCSACNKTGYDGRIGIYETLVLDEQLRELIHTNAPESEIRLMARKGGMKNMREDGERWLETGITTESEIIRVTKE